MIERGELGPDDRVGVSGPPRRLADFPAFADAVAAASKRLALEKAKERAEAPSPSEPSPIDTIPSEPAVDSRAESAEDREARIAEERKEKEARRQKALRDIERRKAEEAAAKAPKPAPSPAPDPAAHSSDDGDADEPQPKVLGAAASDVSDRSAGDGSPESAHSPAPARRSRRASFSDDRPIAATAEDEDTAEDGAANADEADGDTDDGEAEDALLSSDESAPIEIPKGGFPADVIRLSGLELRKKLLASPIEDILGIPVTSSRSRLMDAVHVRKGQLDQHRDADSDAVGQRLGLLDSRRILIAAFEVVRDPRSVREYMTASRDAEDNLVAFEDFVEFEKSLHDPSALGRAQAANAEAETELPEHIIPEHKTSSLDSQAASILGEAEMLVINLRERAKLEKQIEFDKLTPAQKRRRRRMAQISSSFRAVVPEEVGTTTSGPISYGVGDTKTGVLSVAPSFVILFGGILFVMIATRFDQFETRFDDRSPLGWIRAGMMVVLAIASMRLLRRESLSRLGWKPHWKPGLVTMVLLSPLLFFACAAILPFEVKGEPAFAVVLGVVIARAISEALFFEGFLHRTLLVELPSAPVAHCVSVAAYVVYMNTYRYLWDPNDPQHAGALFYGLFMALPAGYVFYRTRSWPVSAIVRLACLTGTAFAASRAAGIV